MPKCFSLNMVTTQRGKGAGGYFSNRDTSTAFSFESIESEKGKLGLSGFLG